MSPIPVTPTGIESATFWLVALCLNQLRATLRNPWPRRTIRLPIREYEMHNWDQTGRIP